MHMHTKVWSLSIAYIKLFCIVPGIFLKTQWKGVHLFNKYLLITYEGRRPILSCWKHSVNKSQGHQNSQSRYFRKDKDNKIDKQIIQMQILCDY